MCTKGLARLLCAPSRQGARSKQMLVEPQKERGVGFVRAALMGLLLMALTSVFLAFPARDASAQTSPNADYRFQGTRTSSVGTAPALTDIGPGTNVFATAAVDGTSRRVLRFPRANGVALSPTMGV